MADEAGHDGGCLCGAVRYRVSGTPTWVSHCHCESCWRATGSAVATWAGFTAERFAVVRGEITRFASSPGVLRGFCGACGSPLTFEGGLFQGEVYLTIGSLDEPNALPPTSHAFTSERIAWLHLDEELQQFAEGPDG